MTMDRRLKIYGFLLLTLMLGIMLGVNVMFFFGDLVILYVKNLN